MRVLLEVCIETIEDAHAAQRGGADRLELCAKLDADGLTPSVHTVREIKKAVNLPIMVMLRPHNAGHVYTAAELTTIELSLAELLALQPMGFVVGALNADRTVNRTAVERLRERSVGRELVFHRAFDETPDPHAALETLIACGVDRVLSSGQASSAEDGAELLQRLIAQAAGRITVMPGVGIRAENVAAIVQCTGATEVHGSFKQVVNGKRSTDTNRVRAARQQLDHAVSGGGTLPPGCA